MKELCQLLAGGTGGDAPVLSGHTAVPEQSSTTADSSVTDEWWGTSSTQWGTSLNASFRLSLLSYCNRASTLHHHVFCISQVVRGRQRMKQATYVFFLDLRKAYDTVWREGLLYKLWQLGIRGRMWHYINALYTTSRRVVRSDGQLSSEVEIDLGVAQRDTMSCILFNLFVNQ